MSNLANETQTPVTEKTDLKTQLAEVAERIRTMREIMGLSEEEMAQRAGVSVEDYRKYELGESDFSFTFIFKCAERFGIDPTDLIKGVSPTLSTYTVSRRGEGLPITRRHGFKYLNLAPLFKQKTAEPFYVTMPYNEAEQNVAIKLSTHQGQELDIIVKGKMRVQVGSHTEELEAGDTIYYNSGTPHGMIAIGGEDCEFYAIVMRPGEEMKPEKDKFEGIDYEKKSFMPVVKSGCGYVVCRVVSETETSTHTVFIGEVIDAGVFSKETPMTYRYYHEVIKGTSPKNAPTFVAE